MNLADLRCTAEHPRLDGARCDAKLGEGAGVLLVRVLSLALVGAGCVAVDCPRCGARYVILPVAESCAAG